MSKILKKNISIYTVNTKHIQNAQTALTKEKNKILPNLKCTDDNNGYLSKER